MPAVPTPPLRSGWIADCHVHLHSEFDVTSFLDGAARNLRRTDAPGFTGMLCLADIGSQESLARLRHGAPGWSVEGTQETESLLVRGAAGLLAIIAGRQVVTAERLEVLMLGSARPLADGAPLDRTLELADAAGGVAVLPWGVGKWTFDRARIVARVLAEADPRALLVGDNGTRPGIVPEPRLLRVARARGFRVLPGSDPLPLAFHAARAGSCQAAVPPT